MTNATLKDYNYGQYESLEKFQDCFNVGGGVRGGFGKRPDILRFFGNLSLSLMTLLSVADVDNWKWMIANIKSLLCHKRNDYFVPNKRSVGVLCQKWERRLKERLDKRLKIKDKRQKIKGKRCLFLAISLFSSLAFPKSHTLEILWQ